MGLGDGVTASCRAGRTGLFHVNFKSLPHPLTHILHFYCDVTDVEHWVSFRCAECDRRRDPIPVAGISWPGGDSRLLRAPGWGRRCCQASGLGPVGPCVCLPPDHAVGGGVAALFTVVVMVFHSFSSKAL